MRQRVGSFGRLYRFPLPRAEGHFPCSRASNGRIRVRLDRPHAFASAAHRLRDASSSSRALASRISSPSLRLVRPAFSKLSFASGMSYATVAAGALSRASAPAQLRRGSLKAVARPASCPTARRLAPAAAMTDEGLAAQARAEAIRDDLPEVLIAGGGIAGLITALALQRKGMKVKVFEKVKEYKLFGGPIQLQCNAQGALDSIAPDVLEQVWEKSTITGDRINGLLDGVAGDWFYRFDTRKPCYENGLPLTLVIARYDLLEILRDAVGAENIEMETVVAKYENVGEVRATLTDGTVHEGDVLIGADGIRSKMRAQMRDEDPENPPLAYAGYAVYTAICDYSAPHREPQHTDVEKTGYQVFLGPKQYFVSSDVGNGQQQYYAFLDVPPGGEDKYAKCEDWETTRDAPGSLPGLVPGGAGAPGVHQARGRGASRRVRRAAGSEVGGRAHGAAGRLGARGAAQPRAGRRAGDRVARTPSPTSFPSARVKRG